MTVGTFIIFIAVGSALVALWINVRFPKLMPWNLGRMLLHVVIAVLCVYAVGPAMSIVTDSGIPAPNLAAVFGIGFPTLVYEFLVGAWLIRLAQATASGFRV
jgi:hypothetical protein